MAPKSEFLFIDPSVSDIDTLLGGLRPEVESIVLDRERPASRQMAEALAGRRNLDAIHVIAHGSPGRVSFAAGEWSVATISDASADLVAMGEALRPGGDLRLWSCHAGAGSAGEALIELLSKATGVTVAASSGLVGAQARGGSWELDLAATLLPPLAKSPIGEYAGLLAGVYRVVSGEIPHNSAINGTYVVVNSKSKQVVGTFLLPQRAENISKFRIVVTVPSATEAYEAGRLDEQGKFISDNFTISQSFPTTATVNARGARYDS